LNLLSIQLSSTTNYLKLTTAHRKVLRKILKTRILSHSDEKKFAKMEEKTPDEMAMAEKAIKKGKEKEKVA